MYGVASTPISSHSEFPYTEDDYDNARRELEDEAAANPNKLLKDEVFKYCDQIFHMLKDFKSEGRTDTVSGSPSEAARFDVTWAHLVELAKRLPGPTEHDCKSGQNNFRYKYVVTGRTSYAYGPCFERRYFGELSGTGYYYSARHNNYFYYNVDRPGGEFYCGYVDNDGDLRGRMYRPTHIRDLRYPPDVPSRESGGHAERY